MPRLTWDNVGSRLYQIGLDRGVLYLTNGSGVVWNGLTSIVEEPSGSTTSPFYFDGKKYFDFPGESDFSGTIQAITYPNEFLEFDGYKSAATGLYYNNQNRNTFSLSYRTYVGNDLLNENYGYKIHIIYNLTTDPSTNTASTIKDTVEISQFSWKVYSRPEAASGYFPVSHVVIDSKIMSSTGLTAIENKLYGTAVTNPSLPTLTELQTLAAS